MLTWAKVIPDFDAVPAGYRGACRALLGQRATFPYVVFAPAMGGLRHSAGECLLCDVDDTFYILRRAGEYILTIGYPWQTLRDIEYGNLLLYTWITISGLTIGGAAEATTVEFNLATERHFRPFINKMRPAALAGADREAELAKFDYLSQPSFKFMNFARESLVPGETVLQTLWQPELRRRSVPLLPLSRTLSLAHLTILTDQELILIEDDARSVKRLGTRYGGIWRYIPRRQVSAAAVAERDDGRLTLTLHLTAAGRIERTFAPGSREALAQFQQEIEKREPPVGAMAPR